jgi:hypothetical protein
MRCQQTAHPAGLAVVLLSVAVSAGAQSELPMPKFEIGIDLVAGDISGGRQSATRLTSPRVTVNLSPVWAIDVMTDKATNQLQYATYVERNWLIQAGPTRDRPGRSVVNVHGGPAAGGLDWCRRGGRARAAGAIIGADIDRSSRLRRTIFER